MKKIIYLSVFILSVFFYACETDFDINADWKNITSVYCMLNKNDTAHYVKVNKAFLGNASAYEMAQHSDSFNYANANVYFVELKKTNGNWTEERTITCEKTTEIPKDSGIFATDNNILYKTKAILNSSTNNYKYRLVVEIPGKEKVWGETEVFDNKTITPSQAINVIAMHNYSAPAKIEWKSVANARIYELSLRYYFYEITATDTSIKYVDWSVEEITTASLTGGETMKVYLAGSSFFSNLNAKIKENSNVIKRISKQKAFEVTFTLGDDNLYTYKLISAPSDGISQEKPVFTNINNGYGLFCARSTSFYNNNNTGIKINPDKTLDSLNIGSYTKKLKFATRSETNLFWLQHPE